MSRQYRRTKNKKQNKDIKPDSRVHAVDVSSEIKYEIMSDGTRVKQEVFESVAKIEQINNGPDATLASTAVVYSSQEEENDRKRGEVLSDSERRRIRSDPHSFQINEKVVHTRHKSFGIGCIVHRVKSSRVDHNAEYRWEVQWIDRPASRVHTADYLLKWPDVEPLKEGHIETAKHPNPNRAFREHKSREQFLHGFLGHYKKCAECGADLPDEKDDRQQCHDCRRTLDKPKIYDHYFNSTLAAMPEEAEPRSRPTTRIQKRLATAKQLQLIAELGMKKGVANTADMTTLTFPAAVDIIDAWSEMPDFSYSHQPRISIMQKRIIASLEKRLRVSPMTEQALNLYSAKQATQRIEKMQRVLDEA